MLSYTSKHVSTLSKDDSDLSSHGATTVRWGRYLPTIAQLPTELFTSVLHLALPCVDLTSCQEAYTSRLYMRALYIIRRASRHWQDVVDGTLSFWTVVLSTLPPHVNNATILRSATLPLTVVYEYSSERNIHGHPSSRAFYRSIAHTRARWSALILDISGDGDMPEYLADPAPLLQTVIVRSSSREELDIEPLEMLGGQTENLRYVAISVASIRWKMGLFTQLKALHLTSIRQNLTVSHVVDFARASPSLEELSIGGALELAASRISPLIITLLHLKSIELECSDIRATEYILQHIRAPSCIKFAVYIGEEDEHDVSRFVHETLKPFQDILRRIHIENGASEMAVKTWEFDWRSRTEGDGDRGFTIKIETYFPMGIHWVEEVLQREGGVQVRFYYGAALNNAIMRDIAMMRCATSVVVGAQWAGRLDQFFQLLCQPLSPDTHVPPLPNLRAFSIPSTGWVLQDLLDMVQLRRTIFSEGRVEQPPLRINIRVDMWDRKLGLPTIPDLVNLTKIKGVEGVEGVRFLGPPEGQDGMIGVVWNEEASAPTWGQ
ncbi:hypothetical protein FRC01_001948 [Tulasnella sp. 417]|nr:hypothetical protein FRC01_001948 [Tulasnella sp. 417]